GVPRAARRGLAGDARGPSGQRLAGLLAPSHRRRPPHRPPRDRRLRGGAGGDGAHRGQRPVAGRDGGVLRRLGPARPGDDRRAGDLPPRGPAARARPADVAGGDPTPRSAVMTQPQTQLRTTAARAALAAQTIELPSWAFGNSGTRFKVFGQPGVPRDPYEKIADAAQVHRYTGAAPRVSLHIPWDLVDDFGALRRHAEDLGVQLGAINSNVFQDDDYMLGSLTNPDPKVRRKAVDAHLRCLEVMNETGSQDLKIWLADGLNYPGQDDLRSRQDRLAEGLAEIYAALAPHQRIILEYKSFEPAFYATDVPDWGTSLLHCMALGAQAMVVLDTRHRAPGTNIEL